jgi:hypothetical protein
VGLKEKQVREGEEMKENMKKKGEGRERERERIVEEK